MTEKILVVDDEVRVLSGIKRSLHGKFDVITAEGGAAGLDVLAERDDIAVVMSDMRMPGMDGVQFLSNVKRGHPALIRLMLTGNSDLETARKAVNDGEVFRFLNKPCTQEDLSKALNASLQQARLLRAEKDVLEKTLSASITAMTSLLSLVQPKTFGSISRISDLAIRILDCGSFDVEEWTLRTATSLSTLGYLTLPPRLIQQRVAGTEMSAAERNDFAAHAMVGADLVQPIPRMDKVAEIIRYQEHRFDGRIVNHSERRKGADLPEGARILHAANGFDVLRQTGWSSNAALETLRADTGEHDPAVLNALASVVSASQKDEVATLRVPAAALRDGMIIQEDIITRDGVLVVCKGQVINSAVAKHLQNFAELDILDKAPLVSQPRE